MLLFKNSYVFTTKQERLTKSLVMASPLLLFSTIMLITNVTDLSLNNPDVLTVGNKSYVMPTALPPSVYHPNATQSVRSLSDYMNDFMPQVFNVNVENITTAGAINVGNVKFTKRNIEALIKWGNTKITVPINVSFVNADSNDYTINAYLTFEGLTLKLYVETENVNSFVGSVSVQITL